MTNGDLAAVEDIQKASPEASHWPPADYLNYETWVAEEAGSIAGFVAIRPLAGDEFEVLNTAVVPARRGTGIGRRLMEFVLGSHRGTWFLEVRESNEKALNLYKGLGFQQIGSRKNYYTAPAEGAIVMRIRS